MFRSKDSANPKTELVTDVNDFATVDGSTMIERRSKNSHS